MIGPGGFMAGPKAGPDEWQPAFGAWSAYPIGTLARESWSGATWEKTERGWKAMGGSTFQRPACSDQVKTPNVELTGAAPALSAQRPATEGSEVERRVGGAVLPAPTFELHGPDGKTWMLYEDGTSTGFPEGTVIVNRAKPQLDLLRGRIKEFEAALIADQQ